MNKALKFGIISGVFFIAIMFLVQAARLPQTDGDEDNWGAILNDFLMQQHTTSGGHKDLTVEGKVGIGIAEPEAILHISGDDGSDQTQDVVLSSTNVPAGSGIDLENYGEQDFVAYRNTPSPTSTIRAIGFYTSSGITHLMSILNNGKVGIGMTNPVGRLTLKGIVEPQQGLLTFFSDTADMEYDGGSDDLFIFKDTGGITAFMGGKVGIGMTNPVGRLTLKGIVEPQQGLLTFFSDTADMEYDGGSDDLFIFKDTGGITAFMGGKVGIGTTEPKTSLEVSSVIKSTPTDNPGTCDSNLEGGMYYDVTLKEPCYCDGTGWKPFDGSGTC